MLGGTMPDIVVLPVGGGGLAAGVTRYLSAQGKNPRFVFCGAGTARRAPSKEALQAGKRAETGGVDNFVDGAAVAEIGREPLRYLKGFPRILSG